LNTIVRFILVFAFLFPVTLADSPQNLWAETVKTFSADKRFIDNGDETITDTKTGLMWMKKDSYLNIGHWLNWKDCIVYVKKMNQEAFAGYIDWRMPTLEELGTLYDKNKFNSKQIGHEMAIHIDPIFAPEGVGSIWSTNSNGVYNAVGFVYNSGRMFNSKRTDKARKGVRPVRTASN